MTGRKAHTYRGHSGAVSTIAWSPDGKWIASAGTDCTIQVWAAENMGKLCTYTRHSEKVNALAWSPTRITSSLEHGYLIASASADSTVQIWDSTTGHRLFVYRGHAQPVHAVAWSPDGQYIASADEDKMVQVWKVSTKDIPTEKILLTTHSSTTLCSQWHGPLMESTSLQ